MQVKSTPKTRAKPTNALPPKLPPDRCPQTAGDWIHWFLALVLPRGPKLLVGVLIAHIDWRTGDHAYATQDTLAQECGCSKRQLQTDLAVLIATGIVESDPRSAGKSNRANTYKLTPRETKPASPQCASAQSASAKRNGRETKFSTRETKSTARKPVSTEPVSTEPVPFLGENREGPSPQKTSPRRRSSPTTRTSPAVPNPVPGETKPASPHDEPDWPTILRDVPRGRLDLYLGPIQLIALGFRFGHKGALVGWPDWYRGDLPVPEQVIA